MTKHIDDELLPATPEEADYHRRLQNQYARLSTGVPQQDAAPVSLGKSPERSLGKTTVAKDVFEAESRRILGLYIPAVEKGGQLRQHHRAFITRNLLRNPAARYRVLKELRKYDLSDMAGFEARFNREEDDLTEVKLKEIEKAAGVDE